MRIDRIRVGAYGPLADLDLEHLAENDLIVVYGPNEAGKSSLRSFVASMLYGFAPAAREDNPATPPDGHAHGELELVLPEGGGVRVERHLRARPAGRAWRGEAQEELANRPLSEVAWLERGTYLALHAFDADELRGLDATTWREIERRLLGGASPAFLRPAALAAEELSARADALWRDNRRGKPRSAELSARLAELREARREALAQAQAHDVAAAELARVRGDLARARRGEAQLEGRRDLHDRHAPALRAWQELERLRSEAEAFVPEALAARVGAQPGDRLDGLRSELEERRREGAELSHRARGVARLLARSASASGRCWSTRRRSARPRSPGRATRVTATSSGSTLLHASERFHEAQTDFAKLGIKAQVELDLPAMMAQKDKVVGELTKGVEFLFRKNKVEGIVGEARIIAPGKVEVKGKDGAVRSLTAKHIIIATGSDVSPLPGVTIDEEQIVSSTGALSLKQVPKKMLVVGAGVIGLELGSVWKRLGSEVTVIEFLDRITPGMDLEVSKAFQRILTKQGMTFQLSTKVTGVEKKKTGLAVTVEPAAGGDKSVIETDVMMVSIGRRPYTDNLGLDKVGVALDKRGRVVTDAHYKTNVRGHLCHRRLPRRPHAGAQGRRRSRRRAPS